MSIRIATPNDSPAFLRIYAPAVIQTTASFEMEPPSVEEMQQRVKTILERYPWLTFEGNGQILGYAYASEYRKRPAYQWSVEVSVYVDESARGQGIGKTLYRELLAILSRQGFFNAYAGITLPNPSSVALHEAVGFRLVGVFKNVGYKFDRWHDVGFWHLVIQQHADVPGLPINFPLLEI